MEFLKELFGDQALTFDALTKAVDAFNAKAENKEKQIKLGNVAGGEYVSRRKFDDKVTELNNAAAQITTLTAEVGKLKTGEDPEQLKGRLEQLQKQYDADVENVKKLSAIKDALYEKGAKHIDLLATKFDLETIEITEKGKIVGVEKQLTKITEDYADLFPVEGDGDEDEGDDPNNDPAYEYDPAGGEESGTKNTQKSDFVSIINENRLIKD